jgi:flagellar biosynthesis protein FlhF
LKIKKYIGHSLQEALNLAREELGDQVILLESAGIDPDENSYDAKPMVEITVTLPKESTPQKERPTPAPPPPDNPHPANPFANLLNKMIAAPTATAPSKNPEFNEQIQALLHEMKRMNLRLHNLNKPDFPEDFAWINEKLLLTGMSEEDANAFVRRAYLKLEDQEGIGRPEIIEAVREEISFMLNQLKYNPPKKMPKPRVMAFVGPAGCGKTTTIMKLGLNIELAGARRVAIISTDRYRMAAAEQLKAYTKVSGVPVIELRDPANLSNELSNMRGADLVLIDTPGRNPMIDDQVRELQTLFANIDGIEIVMVTSATTDLQDNDWYNRRYQILKPAGLAITKIDELQRPGKLVSLIQRSALPLYYFGFGQTLMSDLANSDSSYILDKIFMEIK